MRKIIKSILALIMVIGCFKVSAEAVWYQVKYANEYHNVQTVKYIIFTDKTTEDVGLYTYWSRNCKYNEIIDKDSDARDLAIINKLNVQGYTDAYMDDYDCTRYMKIEGKWHKIYCWK